jgi:hypothetical protein
VTFDQLDGFAEALENIGCCDIRSRVLDGDGEATDEMIFYDRSDL